MAAVLPIVYSMSSPIAQLSSSCVQTRYPKWQDCVLWMKKSSPKAALIEEIFSPGPGLAEIIKLMWVTFGSRITIIVIVEITYTPGITLEMLDHSVSSK